jgi:hypothetical protein
MIPELTVAAELMQGQGRAAENHRRASIEPPNVIQLVQPRQEKLNGDETDRDAPNENPIVLVGTAVQGESC